MSRPSISVITITKNDPHGLSKTLESFGRQHCTDKELIVVDGGTSGFADDLFELYGDVIGKLVRESDEGIFDAMNKGLSNATGRWVLFLNSGDVFADRHVLGKLLDALTFHQVAQRGVAGPAVDQDGQRIGNGAIFADNEDCRSSGVAGPDEWCLNNEKTNAKPKEGIGVIYGDSIADYGDFQVYRKAGLPAELWKGMFCNHQSMLFRRDVLTSSEITRHRRTQTTVFNPELSITADHDLVYRLHSSGIKFLHLPIPVAIWDTRGISNRKQIRSVAERFRMIAVYSDRDMTVRLYYLWLLWLAFLVQGMYGLLPGNIMAMLIRLMNRKSLIKQSKPEIL